MLSQLELAKSKVREQLLKGTADGVIGVGIDPTGGQSPEGSLIVFFSDQSVAEAFLKNTLNSLFFLVDLQSGSRLASPSPSFKRGFLEFVRGIWLKLAPFTLTPATQICQFDSRPLGPGEVGCFLTLKDGFPAVLTVRHLFDGSNKFVHFYNGAKCTKKIVGDSLDLPILDSINLADCALFFPMNVDLQGDAMISGNFVPEDKLSQSKGKEAMSLASTGLGRVLDTAATIKYPLPDSASGQLVLFDSQIFVRSVNDKKPFGIPGDSGALVLLGEGVNSLKKGDALGLYTWTDAINHYHFLTPLYACIREFKAETIFNPAKALSSKKISLARGWKFRPGNCRFTR